MKPRVRCKNSPRSSDDTVQALPQTPSVSRMHPRSPPSSPGDKSKLHFNGTLSPLHTRRRTHSDDMARGGGRCGREFASFSIAELAPNLLAASERTPASQISFRDILNELDEYKLIHNELEDMLVHNIDHMKKIHGEVTFQNTGEYPPADISSRPMPVYTLRDPLDAVPGCSKATEDDSSVGDPFEMEKEVLNESFTTWPPVNLPQKFWTFTKQYVDPPDEAYLQQYWTNVLQPLCGEKIRRLYEFEDLSKRKEGVSSARERRSSYSAAKDSTDVKHHEIRSPSAARGFSSQKAGTGKHLTSEMGTLGGPSSKTPRLTSKLAPLVGDVMRAFVDERRSEVTLHRSDLASLRNGSLEHSDKKSPKNAPLLNGGGKVGDLKSSRHDSTDSAGAGQDELLQVNGETNENGAECAAMFDKLACSLSEHLLKFGLSGKCDSIGAGGEGSEDFNWEQSNSFFNEEQDDHDDEQLDEVSAALKKSQRELRAKERRWRECATKAWHRLLGEYLRSKQEAALDKADQELFEIHERFYRDFPRQRPGNDSERELCAAALRRRNELALAFYGDNFNPNGGWTFR